MKKTLITAILALFCASLASAIEQVTFTCTEESVEAAGHNAEDEPRINLNSFNFDLGNSLWLTQDPQAETLPETAYLTAMTFYFYSATDPCGVAIYQLRDPDDTGLVHLDYVGKSNWLSEIDGNALSTKPNTFTFDWVALHTGENYIAMFYGNETAFEELKEGHVLTGQTNEDVGDLINKLAPVSVNQNEPIYSPSMMWIQMDETVAGGAYDDNGDFHPKVSPQVVIEVLIPEPTTATLSLLGLMGLCARRRRK